VSIADDVRFIDSLALAFFFGDVLDLRTDQFPLDRLPHGCRRLIEADLGLACLGDLAYSLPLAPCQKKTIAIIDWERRETAEPPGSIPKPRDTFLAFRLKGTEESRTGHNLPTF
jgi:hypothetical protein